VDWDSRVLTLYALLVKASHVVCSEGRHQRAHLVEDAAQGPDVTLGVVGHVSPHLRTGIVGCTSLSVTQALLYYFRDVEVSQLGLHVLEQKDVRALHVTMQNPSLVESVEATDDLNEDVPDLLLLEVGLSLLIVTDLLKYVAVISILHDQAQSRTRFVNKGIFISNDVGVVNRGQNSHFVQRILLLFVREVQHLNFLKGVYLWVFLTLDLEY